MEYLRACTASSVNVIDKIIKLEKVSSFGNKFFSGARCIIVIRFFYFSSYQIVGARADNIELRPLGYESDEEDIVFDASTRN